MAIPADAEKLKIQKEKIEAMIDVILFEPEIPGNTGNIIRLCANTGARLHLVEPLGFIMDDKRLRRAGLDYHEWADVAVWPDLSTCLQQLPTNRLWAMSTKGQRLQEMHEVPPCLSLLFGPESRGLPAAVLEDQRVEVLRLPMCPGSRSLNLANAVAVCVYECWRQQGYDGGV